MFFFRVEVAVARFLEEKISFLDIPRAVERALTVVPREETLTLDAIRRADKLAREAAEEFCTAR